MNLAELYDVLSFNILTPAMVGTLADELGVNKRSLLKLGLGYHPTIGNRAYVFPERDSQGDIVGMAVRTADKKKFMIKGSSRGLYYELNPKFMAGKGEYIPGKQNWMRVSDAGVNCPICEKPDWCLVSADDPDDPMAVICSRVSEGSNVAIRDSGHLHILKPQGQVSKSSHGLLMPTQFPILITEGYSDTVAAVDMGFVAVGRPSAEGCTHLLPELVPGKEVIIVGDNDAGAGKRGTEATFTILHPICAKVTKVYPPEQFKDLRQWKNQTSLTREQFLVWVAEHGESSGDPNILEDDAAATVAKAWLEREKMDDGLPTIRCYRGQWVEYRDGRYSNCDKEEFRGQIYRFLEKKTFPRIGAKGQITIAPYKASKSKVSDIIDALNAWCTVADDPPVWLKGRNRPAPENLIAFKNGVLDVNAYVRGKVVLHNPSPALFSFNVLPYDFDEDINSDLWESFLVDVFNDDLDRINLLAEWFGYNCVPDMSQEKLMLCTGRPRSGKGTVLNALSFLLGRDQCTSTSFQTLCTEFGYQPLIGKLAVLLGDAKVPRQREASAALEKILQVVGRDPIGVRRMYLSYLPQIFLRCRFTIAMNDLPNIPDQANALEPRLNILYFENSYVGRENIKLKSELQEQAEQGKLVNFALRGLVRLRTNGIFTVPISSLLLLKQLKELTTPVASFIADCCLTEPPDAENDPGSSYYMTKEESYEAWVVWCKDSGRKPGVREQFGRWLLAACPGILPSRCRINDRRHYIFRGIKLAPWVYQQYLGRAQ